MRHPRRAPPLGALLLTWCGAPWVLHRYDCSNAMWKVPPDLIENVVDEVEAFLPSLTTMGAMLMLALFAGATAYFLICRARRRGVRRWRRAPEWSET